VKTVADNFKKAIEEIFGGYLAEFGFIKTKSEASPIGFSVTYRCDTRYVRFGGTLHPHDYPFYYYLSLGEGRGEMPESDWNGIALWKIVEHVAPAKQKETEHIYGIEATITSDEIRMKIQANLELCKEYGLSFLKNDLSDFHRLRADQNKVREPYKLYAPKGAGKFTVSDDKESAELKKKYSK